MPTADLDLTVAADLISRAQTLIDTATDQLAERGGIDANQAFAYDLAHAASAVATARFNLDYAARGTTEAKLTAAFLADALANIASRILGREALWGVSTSWYEIGRAHV